MISMSYSLNLPVFKHLLKHARRNGAQYLDLTVAEVPVKDALGRWTRVVEAAMPKEAAGFSRCALHSQHCCQSLTDD